MLGKAEQGGLPGKVPVGYINNEQPHTVDVDEARAGFIRKLFELYASGEYSLTALRAKCIDVEFKTRRSEKQISRSNLEKVLKNIFFMTFVTPLRLVWRRPVWTSTKSQNCLGTRISE